MARLACYVCGIVRRKWRLEPVEGKPWRLCLTCVRVMDERQQAYGEGLSFGHSVGFTKGREHGVAEEKGRRWVDGPHGKVNT